jgi:hypothetical protein
MHRGTRNRRRTARDVQRDAKALPSTALGAAVTPGTRRYSREGFSAPVYPVSTPSTRGTAGTEAHVIGRIVSMSTSPLNIAHSYLSAARRQPPVCARVRECARACVRACVWQVQLRVLVPTGVRVCACACKHAAGDGARVGSVDDDGALRALAGDADERPVLARRSARLRCGS